MKFSIGDQILLKRTGEEGTVVAFLTKSMMEVEVNGVRFPVYNEEVDHPYLKWFTEKKKPRPRKEPEIPTEKAADRPQRLARGIYLSFLPQFVPGTMDDIIESFRIHFINETPDAISFSYHARDSSGRSLFQLKAGLHAFGHVYLHPLSLEELNAQPRFHWGVVRAGVAENGFPQGVLRIRPAQLVRHIRDMLAENNPGFSLLLAIDAEHISTAAADASEPVSGAGRSQVSTASHHILYTPAEPVVDLHLVEQAQDPAYPAEGILTAQLNHLQRKIQAALAAGMPGMIVIHGIGNGTLRRKVHELLSETEGVRSFSNHWMARYGWGATELVFGAG